jgi:hypothetical protein
MPDAPPGSIDFIARAHSARTKGATGQGLVAQPGTVWHPRTPTGQSADGPGAKGPAEPDTPWHCLASMDHLPAKCQSAKVPTGHQPVVRGSAMQCQPANLPAGLGTASHSRASRGTLPANRPKCQSAKVPTGHSARRSTGQDLPARHALPPPSATVLLSRPNALPDSVAARFPRAAILASDGLCLHHTTPPVSRPPVCGRGAVATGIMARVTRLRHLGPPTSGPRTGFLPNSPTACPGRVRAPPLLHAGAAWPGEDYQNRLSRNNWSSVSSPASGGCSAATVE